MKITEFKPNSQLASFIDAYWEITCREGESSFHKVLPDGCVDIIMNLGEDFLLESDNVVLQNETAYLGGAITHFKEGKTARETHLVGVRFKPSAFSHFYAFSSLHETTNKLIEISGSFVPGIAALNVDIASAFDSFYSGKLIQPKRPLLPVIQTVTECRGDITVRELANTHFTTIKQLERHFKYQVGLSPKEFINIIRYRFAQQLIIGRHRGKALNEVAFECGYYDQAHLCKEIKKYTGVAPSDL